MLGKQCVLTATTPYYSNIRMRDEGADINHWKRGLRTQGSLPPIPHPNQSHITWQPYLHIDFQLNLHVVLTIRTQQGQQRAPPRVHEHGWGLGGVAAAWLTRSHDTAITPPPPPHWTDPDTSPVLHSSVPLTFLLLPCFHSHIWRGKNHRGSSSVWIHLGEVHNEVVERTTPPQSPRQRWVVVATRQCSPRLHPFTLTIHC